jgi:hypothetical protein
MDLSSSGKKVEEIIYCDMMELWLEPQLLQYKQNVVLKHDGAPPHINIGSCQRDGSAEGVHFRASVISRSDPHPTPAVDIFLWSFVKDEVYVPPMPITLNNLKARIRTAIARN